MHLPSTRPSTSARGWSACRTDACVGVVLTLVFLLVVPLVPSAFAADTDEDRQAGLDADCEAARQKKLAPIRRRIEAECRANQQGDEAYCKRYAAGYNGERISGGPRFYELPECQAAFEYRNSHRNPGRD